MTNGYRVGKELAPVQHMAWTIRCVSMYRVHLPVHLSQVIVIYFLENMNIGGM